MSLSRKNETNAGGGAMMAAPVSSSMPPAVAVVPGDSSSCHTQQALAFSLACLQAAAVAAAVVSTASAAPSRSENVVDGDEEEEREDEESDDDASSASMEDDDDGAGTGRAPRSSTSLSSSLTTTLDPVHRLARCRERNREHARRTRLRKKAQLQALQQKCNGLQAERDHLQRILEDRRVASILLNLSGNADPSQLFQLVPLEEETMTVAPAKGPPTLTPCTTKAIALPDTRNEENDCNGGNTNKAGTHNSKNSNTKPPRKSPQSNALCITIDGVPTVLSAKSHVNWKTGVYLDRHGRQQRLDARQLESLRYVQTKHCIVVLPTSEGACF
jgi:hypothetical protein